VERSTGLVCSLYTGRSPYHKIGMLILQTFDDRKLLLCVLSGREKEETQ